MKNNRSWIQTCFARVAKVTPVMLAVTVLVTVGQAKAADKYWRTDGVTTGKWTDSTWGTSSGGPFTVGWTAGDNAIFNAASTNLYVTATAIGNVTVNANTTVTAAGTLSTGGTDQHLYGCRWRDFDLAKSNFPDHRRDGFHQSRERHLGYVFGRWRLPRPVHADRRNHDCYEEK